MTSFDVLSPKDNSLMFKVDCLDTEGINKAVDKATEGATEWRKVPLKERIDILKNFVGKLKDKRDDVINSIVNEMGRPVRYGDGEINGVKDRAEYMISVAEECLKDEVVEDSDKAKRFISKEPLGVILIIAAWNYPYLTAVNNVIPALLAGNSVLLKQSPQTPTSAKLFVAALHDAGVPENVVQAIEVDDKGAEALVKNPRVQFVNFTGSVAVGKKIRQTITDSKRLIGSAMELGGKDPAYVRADADVESAAENIVDGAFFNSGQCCCAIERCYVHQDVYEAFVKKAVEITKGYVLGDPSNKETTLGPMANLRFADNVRSHIKDAVDKGAKLHVEKNDTFQPDTEKSTYVMPQILTNVNDDMLIMKEETFGPVLPIVKVGSDEEAIELMNKSNYGLTASIWTTNTEKALEIAKNVETGTCFMNRCDYIDPALPWVGAKESGLGFSLSKQGFNQFVRPKSFHFKLA